MSEDWKNERAEAAMREGTEAIRKAAEEKAKEEKDNPKTYTENEVLKLLIQCKDRFGGSELHDYTTDSEVESWFNRVKK